MGERLVNETLQEKKKKRFEEIAISKKGILAIFFRILPAILFEGLSHAGPTTIGSQLKHRRGRKPSLRQVTARLYLRLTCCSTPA